MEVSFSIVVKSESVTVYAWLSQIVLESKVVKSVKTGALLMSILIVSEISSTAHGPSPLAVMVSST